MDKVSNPNRIKKEVIVAELKDKLSKSKGLVLTNYQGLKHKQIETLKKALKPLSAEMVVTKNTLLIRALQTSNFKLQTSNLTAPTATFFLYGDPILPLKELAKMIKELNLPIIKFGILDGENLTSEQILKLSTLPSRETLLAQLVFGLKSPISNLHRALNWNLQKFVLTLNAIQKTKEVKNE